MAAPASSRYLRELRGVLGLSQAQMGAALGGLAQTTYASYEGKSEIAEDVRSYLNEIGVNLTWLLTGNGPMLRPGIERIQVVRDEQTGKAVSLRPISANTPANIERNAPQQSEGVSPSDISTAWGIIHEACAAVGARPDLMPAKGLGRLLAIVAEKVSRGDAELARAAMLEEARDLVAAMAGVAK